MHGLAVLTHLFGLVRVVSLLNSLLVVAHWGARVNLVNKINEKKKRLKGTDCDRELYFSIRNCIECTKDYYFVNAIIVFS